MFLYTVQYLLKLKHCPLVFIRTSVTNISSFNGRQFFSSVNKYPFIMQIDTPEFKSIFTSSLQTLLKIFESNNYEIRIAGGAVRDILLGKSPKDVDFATTATPDQMKKMFQEEGIRMINNKGEKHGTITARINNENFEVTTLRIDKVTDGRHAEVQFTTDWELDANRRDLTINSMFLGTDGRVYDYFGGYEDLKKRRVVFVGDPSKRIQEDYLRILRYFRFFGRISEDPDSHDEETINAIKNNVSGLGKITGERIWLELSKIISGNYISSIVQRIISVGAAPYIGLPPTPNVGELISVWERSKNLNMHPICLIVSLLANEDEMLSFHKRCKLSSFERDLGLFLIYYRDQKLSDRPLKPFQALMLKSDRNLSDTRSFILELFKYKCDLQLLHDFQAWEPPSFPVNGLVLKENGVPSGKILGNVLKELKNIWIDKDFSIKKEDLIEMIPGVLNKLENDKKRPTNQCK
ncbi:CCA tRNA nucleotidyltransferase 1, mitochondrial [Halyomorpha halys]|uniref:CCA tRNA nucleotidyltransferase 1, mitochondrial n=1 Tax=Halyomorpha halys TaxID=286706 RepID=UPI0006D526D8|nr:CCA tRNA nucleotidyltransferase 1, mitochondrial [Halyomorpha halys]